MEGTRNHFFFPFNFYDQLAYVRLNEAILLIRLSLEILRHTIHTLLSRHYFLNFPSENYSIKLKFLVINFMLLSLFHLHSKINTVENIHSTSFKFSSCIFSKVQSSYYKFFHSNISNKDTFSTLDKWRYSVLPPKNVYSNFP